MICYKDTTFCLGAGCVRFHGCPSALTDAVRREAEGAGLLISEITDPRELECYKAPTEDTK